MDSEWNTELASPLLAESNIFVSDSSGGENRKVDRKEESEDEEAETVQDSLPRMYRQDVVKCKSNGDIGTILEIAGDTESESEYSEDDDEDDEEDVEVEAEDEYDKRASDREEGEVTDSGDENADNDESDEDNEDLLPANQVRVLWLNGSEKKVNISDVEVIDRGFLHGDYVASASNPTGQLGVVVDTSITVDLFSQDGSLIKGISSKDLKRVRDFVEGDYVVLGPWLGRVDDVLDNVTVLFDDGAVCKVLKADPETLIPVEDSNFDGHFPYYPGQRVRATTSSVFKGSRWLSGLWKANRKVGTVINVSVGSVLIYWIASAGYGRDCSTAPAEEQSPKNLKILSCLSYANWELGDWCFLPASYISSKSGSHGPLTNDDRNESEQNEPESSKIEHEVSLGCTALRISSTDTTSMGINSSVLPDNSGVTSGYTGLPDSSACSSLADLNDTVTDPQASHRKKIRKIIAKKGKHPRQKEKDFERALLIATTKSTADVLWQDGSMECGIVSTSLIPVNNPGDHEFVAEQYVLEKALDETDNAHEVRRVGVVKSVNAKERTACVRWLKAVSRAEDPREFGEEEVVSVYELEGHPDYDYCYGDVIVRLTPVPLPNTQLGSLCSEENCMNEDQHDEACKEADGVSDKDVCENFSDLTWVGNITGLKNGDIDVTWADGMVSTVGPQSIYVVGRDEDDDSVAGSEVSGAASWATHSDDETDVVPDSNEETALESAPNLISEVNKDDNSGRNGALSIPLAAIGFVTRLATGIFSRGWNNSDHSSTDTVGLMSPESGLMENSDKSVSIDQASSLKSNESDEADNEKTHLSAEANTCDSGNLSEESETLKNTNTEQLDETACHGDDCSFKQFDTSADPVDHHFLGANIHGKINNGRKWLKKVQQDWNILQNNLPEGIYVRVYEDRMDLLRAVIVGAYGTPYQDGLFFFDFHLPSEYPAVPPSVYYHSGGWRINPNLYEEGKVCLSLLNTWSGKGNEVWDPVSSSILQVLVSLQGLVLNSKPYFNEAGYDKQVGTIEGEKNSLSYNENTFLLNCKTMLLLMRRPPKDFEELIKEHFKKRGYFILKACDAYCYGQLIGSLKSDASASGASSPDSTSVGFKLMIAKILPKLFVALKEVGAQCDEFAYLQQS